MRQAVALSPCEVDGKLYASGETISLTDHQFDSLRSLGVVQEVLAPRKQVSSFRVQEPTLTLATADAGFSYPTKRLVRKSSGRKVKRKEK